MNTKITKISTGEISLVSGGVCSCVCHFRMVGCTRTVGNANSITECSTLCSTSPYVGMYACYSVTVGVNFDTKRQQEKTTPSFQAGETMRAW